MELVWNQLFFYKTRCVCVCSLSSNRGAKTVDRGFLCFVYEKCALGCKIVTRDLVRPNAVDSKVWPSWLFQSHWPHLHLFVPTVSGGGFFFFFYALLIDEVRRSVLGTLPVCCVVGEKSAETILFAQSVFALFRAFHILFFCYSVGKAKFSQVFLFLKYGDRFFFFFVPKMSGTDQFWQVFANVLALVAGTA